MANLLNAISTTSPTNVFIKREFEIGFCHYVRGYISLLNYSHIFDSSNTLFSPSTFNIFNNPISSVQRYKSDQVKLYEFIFDG